MTWKGQHVLVTGGASFIGSHLVDALVARGATVRVVDNLSSGRRENLAAHLERGAIEFVEGDLLDPGVADRAIRGVGIVFHLAADHGGRGYVDLHQAACASNLLLDGIVFHACRKAGVDKVVYASSGCVYPNHLQTDVSRSLFLTEDMVGPPFDADNMYGWAKLMGELTLKAYRQDWGLKSASCRYFTVYGDRGHENHAVMAMIARAFVGQDPYVVWGNGEQIRNWTHVSDIVSRHDSGRRTHRRRHGGESRNDGADASHRRGARSLALPPVIRPGSSSIPKCRPGRSIAWPTTRWLAACSTGSPR